ncbi:MAG: hypothetical protein II513_04285 [Ruminococcus sp.]|nr:hypothetical protein [Ruminococcus sp.]
MNAQKIDALEELAIAFTDGALDRKSIWNLNFMDTWFVLTLGAAYSMTLIGTMSREQCAEFKFRAAGVYRQLALEAADNATQRKSWCESNRQASLKLSEAFRELAGEQPDAERFMEPLLEAVDLLTRTNVHYKLTAAKLADPDFLKKCQDAVIRHADEWQERLRGSIRWEDYMVLLQSFFENRLDSGMADLAASLDADYLREFARKNVPVKVDRRERLKKIRDGLREIDNKEKRNMP